ncbi:putative phage abortive infection protein [Flavobacterium psychraquaticum]|uniref:putative phage abortive infection protein n=1 Tax=Flavobacterium psychraquaticum TaxID=3103958 RepID=UPI002ACD4A40|nr:putative phage abortive infection protein [Flavobacterium sp. LB-N7T]
MKDTRNVFTTQQFESTFFNLLKTQNDIRQGIVYQVDNYNEQGMKDNPTIYNSQSVFTEIKKFMFEVRENLNKNVKKVEDFLAGEHSELEIKEYIEKFKEVHLVEYFNFKKNPKLSSKIVYKETFDRFDNQLGHYFRNLYHILLYLKESEETEIGLALHDQMLGKKISIIINDKDIEVQKIKKKYSKYSDFVQAQMSATELYLLFYNCLFFSKMKRLVQYYNIVGNLSADDLLFPNHGNLLYPEIEYIGEIIPKLELSTRNQTLKI